MMMIACDGTDCDVPIVYPKRTDSLRTTRQNAVGGIMAYESE